MIKKFSEFVNEGLISDYKRQKEEENKEIPNSDKNFVIEFLNSLSEIKMPVLFTCKNYAFYGDGIKEDKIEDVRSNKKPLESINKLDINDIHITEKSIVTLIDEDNDLLKDDDDYKNIWKSIYKWFEKAYDKNDLKFNGKIKVSTLIKMKASVKKELL